MRIRGAGFDHVLHQLEGIEHAAKASFGVGDDRLQPVEIGIALGVLHAVRQHAAGAKQSDDITVVVVRVAHP